VGDFLRSGCAQWFSFADLACLGVTSVREVDPVTAERVRSQAPEIVEETFYEVGKMTGRNYKLFTYHGSPTAERVAICMGSASKTLEETVAYMNQQGENVGMLNVHLFRPWSTWHFLNELPKTATKLAVLDKTREEGTATAPPLLC